MDAVKDFILGGLAPLWLLLMPYLSALLFCALCLAVFFDRKSIREKGFSAMRMILLLLGIYTFFNAYDFIRYRNTGLTISPINQVWFYLFSAPSDLYNPYVQIQLSAVSNEYQTTFTHAYGGAQMVELGLINKAPKKFEYGKSDELNLKFNGYLCSADMKITQEFNVSYTNYYLSARTNYLPLCRYEIESMSELRPEYKIRVKIDGDLALFMKRYPGSFLTIRNGTTK